MKRKLLLLFTVSLYLMSSCKKDSSKSTGTIPVTANKIAPDGFNFSTSQNVKLNVSLLTNDNEAIKGVVVNVYATGSLSADSVLFRGVTDKSGNLTGTVTVPAYYTKLVIDPAYVGLMRYAVANINSGGITAIIGGKTGYGGDITADVATATSSERSLARFSKLNSLGVQSTDFGYPTGYTAANAFASPTNLGVPAYLEPTLDNVSATMLAYVNASLPEGQSVVKTHPQYLQNAINNVNITAAADVWITFVSEGAGYLNSLAYFTYPTGTPPKAGANGTAAGGIDKITYIFPNASAAGSGGGLIAGQKVHLGTFSAGTTIAFCLVQNAWTGSGVNSAATKFYSLNALNPETTSSLQQHAVMLYDALDQVNLIGFDDQNRQNGGSDNDFNDVMFYASSNPVTAISQTGVQPVDKGLDTDGDGVPDLLDAFPNDATRAFITYYPSASTYADVAFEDNWPSKGDYDMNDLVVRYRYTFISNAKNQVVSMTGDFSVDAAGASFKNGFGLQLPVAASAVSSVTGYKLSTNTYIQLASNGVESGQSKAVIIPFDNHDLMIQNPDFSFFVNTLLSKNKVTSNTASVNVTFASPVDPTVLTPTAINPFLISNLRRTYEVHLPGYAPTDKADPKLFGTGDDNSSVAAGTYYLSTTNWPWAINFSETFSYPVETVNITNAYPHFADWAGSSGVNFLDWYSNLTSGYRNTANIYSK